MSVRINSLKVNRGGPLKDDFRFEPADLNLIYGPNESGKTFIVEALISFLFKSGKRSSWVLRDWSPSGKAVVSGIAAKPVDFTKSKAKLDDLWLTESGLPTDLSRMLIVRAGDTRLSGEGDGVGSSVLKTFLSGEHTLDRIEKRVAKSLRDATLEHGVIQARQTGERKKRDEFRAELNVLDELLKRLDADLDRGAVSSLEKRKAALEEEFQSQDLARRHRANQLHSDLARLQMNESALPEPEEISEAEHNVRSHIEKLKEYGKRSKTLDELRSSADEARWVKHASEVYATAASRTEPKGRKSFLLALTIILLAAAVTTGLLSMPIPLIVCAVGSVIAMLLHHNSVTSSGEDAANQNELAGIRSDFQTRYNRPLASIADLNAMAEKLRDRSVLAVETERQVKDLEGVIAMLEAGMGGFFSRHGLENHPPSEWGKALTGLKTLRSNLDIESDAIEKELNRLDVDQDDFLQAKPAVQWDSERYRQLSEEITELDDELRDVQNSENSLKSILANRTGLDVGDSWEDLRSALQDQRDKKAEEHRQITADILAQICVMDALNGFRALEKERMEEGLASPGLTDPLLSITGTYTGLTLGEDGELILETDDGESFPLDQLSTGAQEQVHLALRTAFAATAMDDTAFLVLDDAFQHSDWRRRERMVDYTLGLVKQGWQVFYFTMDDHMKKLFEASSKKLGDRFVSVEIG